MRPGVVPQCTICSSLSWYSVALNGEFFLDANQRGAVVPISGYLNRD